jgi:basic amino acid/polyamine antiporter, APA family
MNLWRTKPITLDQAEKSNLKRCLNAFDLTLLGIGAIIGAGVFVLTGIAAATKAGPAITISYILAGSASLFAALAYAELATCIGGCGSAYGYAYAGFGEFIAWLIGWNLIFEYALSVATVAIGWSGYINDAFISLGIHISSKLINNPFQGGIINLPAVAIIFALALVLCLGTRQSSRFNAAIVFIKLLAIAIFLGVAFKHLQVNLWSPFMPFGWEGVTQGASLVFFAYIGFDALSTAAEETINPQKNLPIGILLSLTICAVIYIIVAGLLTGIVPYTDLNVASPVAHALIQLGHPIAAGLIAAGAIAGLTTVMLVMYYGLTRVCFAIARDGLLPSYFAKTHKYTMTPIPIILASAIIMATLAGMLPINEAAEMVNIGTLTAFNLVCAGVMVMRWTRPDLARPFKIPLHPVIPLLGILSCTYLMLHLPVITWIRFFAWMIMGIFIYFCYSIKHSQLNKS